MEIAYLDWAKNSSSKVTLKTKLGESIEDRSNSPPYTSFRFKSDQPEIIKSISKALQNYNGKIEWVLTFHDRSPLPGINWTICPKLVLEKTSEAKKLNIDVNEYFRRELPEFGTLAYEDLIDLGSHLRLFLSSSKSDLK